MLKNINDDETRAIACDSEDGEGYTPLHRAVLGGYSDAVKVLCGAGVNTSLQDANGYTALHLAAALDSEEAVDIVTNLCTLGGDMNSKSSDGASPLEVAIMTGHNQVSQALIQQGASVTTQAEDGTGPLHVAVRYNNTTVAKMLLDAGCDVNIASNTDQQTALHLACSNGDVDLTTLLVASGANVECTDSSKWRPIHLAASEGHVDCVKVLVENGATVMCKTAEKQTPLKLAAAGRHEATAVFLLEAKGNEESDKKAQKTQPPEPVKDDKRAAHRSKVLGEILSTEQSYVKGLKVLVKVFLNPMKRRAGSTFKTVTEQDVDAIFSNISSLLDVNKTLLDKLEARYGETEEGHDPIIGDIFVELIPFLKMYTMFINNYEVSRDALNKISSDPDFLEYCDKAKSFPDCGGRQLTDFLITPVQRVPRYVLLLHDLIKHTDDGHPDLPNLTKSLEKVEEIGRVINEAKRKSEHSDQLVSLQSMITSLPDGFEILVPGRSHIRHSVLSKRPNEMGSGRGGVKKRTFVMFSDILMYLKGQYGDKMEYRGHIDLASTDLTDLADGEEHGHSNAFRVADGTAGQSFVIFAKEAATKAEWLSDLTASIAAAKEARARRIGSL